MINLVWLPGLVSAVVVAFGFANLVRLTGRVAHGEVQPDLSEEGDVPKQRDFHRAWSDGGWTVEQDDKASWDLSQGKADIRVLHPKVSV